MPNAQPPFPETDRDSDAGAGSPRRGRRATVIGICVAVGVILAVVALHLSGAINASGH